MQVKLPLEINKRPARVREISLQDTLRVWVTWSEENLPGILWTHARLMYGKEFTWFHLKITAGLSPQKINQLSTGLKRRAYFAGLDADTFDVFPTQREGIYFSWLKPVEVGLMEKRKRQRRKHHSLLQNAEGRPTPIPDVAPLPEIPEEITPPSLPSWARPSRR